MNIHEYQGKELLRAFNVPTKSGKIAFSAQEARQAAEAIGGSLWVVKAQIHAGGRGKGGGVKLARTLDEVEQIARAMIGMTLVTHQTGPQGKLVKKVLVETGSNIKKEYYLGMLVDRAAQKIVIMGSSEGGVEVEKVAAETPDKIIKAYISPVTGYLPSHGRKIAYGIGLKGDLVNKAVKFLSALYKLFVEKDASLAEINPLIETDTGELLALDIKFNFDDNALFRHPDIQALRDKDEEDENEIKAAEHDLSYISLSGNIGCLVNGAGLAMGTLDIIKLNGGEPANFLDVGGSASTEKVTAAFKIILNSPTIKAILVNIFGGIMKCDIIAQGVVAAARELSVRVPLVVCLNGTNVEEGKKILAASGLKITPAPTFAEAARLAVRAAKGMA